MAPQHLVLDLTVGAVPTFCPTKALAASIEHGPFARRVAVRSATATPCSFASFKMNSCFAAESPGELDAMLLADVLEDVVAFRPQPVEVRFFDGERCRSAFPDLGVLHLDGGVQLWEVKGATKSPSLVRRLGHLSASLSQVGIEYRVLTSTWLTRSPRQANARLLYRHANRPLPSWAAGEITRVTSCHGPMTLGSLRAQLGLGLADLAAAAAQGMFAVNLAGAALGEGTPVRLPRTGARSGGFLGMGV